MNAGVIAVITGGIGSLIAAYAFPENLFVISLQSLPELSIWAVHISEKTGAVTLNLFVLISEYVGMAVGFGSGLCTLAVAYAQVFGLPGYTLSVNVGLDPMLKSSISHSCSTVSSFFPLPQ